MNEAIDGLRGPKKDCGLCPRLVSFRERYQASDPDWFNGAVPAFGGSTAQILVVGLAPGLQGANRTGRPFTGDYAGDLLYASLLKAGLAAGTYDKHIDDGLELINCRITNAVRCVPPENKPTGAEQKACRPFLVAEIGALTDLKALLALGKIAHDAVVRTFELKMADYAFAHGAQHELPNGLLLADSYHCSRYNVNTGRLTEAMFDDVITALKKRIGLS